MSISRGQSACEEAKRRANELSVDYSAVFIDVIWDEEIEEIAQIMKGQYFVVATTQTDILKVINNLCKHGFQIKAPISIKDGCVTIYGLILS